MTFIQHGVTRWALDASVLLYRAGGLYVKVHTDTNKGGEIQAQLTP